MWLCTKRGFFSIVKKESKSWHIRARKAQDLENLVDLLNASSVIVTTFRILTSTPDADYGFRIIVTDAVLMNTIFSLLFNDIDYRNFKSMIGCTADQESRLDAYHEIWDIMRAEAVVDDWEPDERVILQGIGTDSLGDETDYSLFGKEDGQ